jgi:hypothetical protein
MNIGQHGNGGGEVVHLFVDLSNLWYALRAEAARRGDPDWAVRLHSANLRRVLAAGRPVGEAVLVANSAVPRSVLAHLRPHFALELVEAGRESGREQAGDELLQNALYRTILGDSRPGTVVIATGDGAGWRTGRGFCPAAEAAHRLGFGVEIASLSVVLNGHLGELARKLGVLVELDRFYDSIAFLEGLRPARTPSLAHRPTAEPATLPVDTWPIRAAMGGVR